MKNKVVLQPEEITVFLFNEVKNLNVKIIYIFINPYQLIVKEVTFFSNNNSNSLEELFCEKYVNG